MIEVIKRGSLPEDKVYETACTHCRSEIRFKRSDAKGESWGNESYLVVKCPICMRNITKEI